jgi:hypothetical protein
MRILTITAKGQITLRNELLKHLGARPGERVAVNKLPDGLIEIKAPRLTGKISDVSTCSRAEGGALYRSRKSTKSRVKGGPETERIAEAPPRISRAAVRPGEANAR